MTGVMHEVAAGARKIGVSRPEKLLFPEDGITKYELVKYYARIADVALPLWRDRPLSMQRYPDGIESDGFFQKDIPDYFPDWVERVTLPKGDGRLDYILPNNSATLAYIAEQGCITPHLGLSRVDRIDCPDRLILDLDPSDDRIAPVQFAAGRVRDLLDELDIVSFVQTTGSRGFHVVVPLDRSETFDKVRDVARDFVRTLAARYPGRLTIEQRKSKRGNRVFLDYLRNAYGQTAVAPYGVRARPRAPVATPLDWDEALASDMSPRKYTVENIFRRLAHKRDPWAQIARHAIAPDTLRRRLRTIDR